MAAIEETNRKNVKHISFFSILKEVKFLNILQVLACEFFILF